jgi:nitrite reductase/ring-hydroxylating ferredoxin subunit
VSWHRALAVAELAKDSARAVEIEGCSIAVLNSGGRVYALENRCLHRGGPLGEGHVEDGLVTCPWHAWQFEVKSGKCRTMEGAKQRTFKAKVEKGDVWIEL